MIDKKAASSCSDNIIIIYENFLLILVLNILSVFMTQISFKKLERTADLLCFRCEAYVVCSDHFHLFFNAQKFLFLKGRVHIFFYSLVGCPPIRGVKLDGS